MPTDYLDRREFNVTDYTALRFPIPVHFVLINGPAGGGKSTLAQNIKHRLLVRNDSRDKHIVNESFKGPVAAVLNLLMPDLDYATQKETVYGGQLGRDIQIDFGALLRKQDPAVLTKALVVRVRDQIRRAVASRIRSIADIENRPLKSTVQLPQLQGAIVIIDDWGFNHELDYLMINDASTTRIYMDYYTQYESNKRVEHGERFIADSRHCYRKHCHLHNPNQYEALTRILHNYNRTLKQARPYNKRAD